MTEFKYNGKIEKLIHQATGSNDVDFCDYHEGCLLDNYVFCGKRGIYFVYESYVNEWCSNYRVEFCKYGSDDINSSWDEWNKSVELWEAVEKCVNL